MSILVDPPSVVLALLHQGSRESGQRITLPRAVPGAFSELVNHCAARFALPPSELGIYWYLDERIPSSKARLIDDDTLNEYRNALRGGRTNLYVHHRSQHGSPLKQPLWVDTALAAQSSSSPSTLSPTSGSGR